MKPAELLGDTVRECIERRDWFALRRELAGHDAPALADLLDGLDPTQRALVFRLLPRDRSSDVLATLDPGQAETLLEGLSDGETRRVLAALAPDERTALLEELPGQLAQRLLNLLPPDELAEARLLLGYPEESVGRLMTPDYVAVRPGWTVEQVLDHIRRVGRRSETVNVLYVVDAAWKLLGTLDVSRVLLAAPEVRVETLMDRSFVSLPAIADRERAVELMRRYDLFALPVTDSEGILVGIVTVDDVLDVAEEEVTEDFHKVAAVAPLPTSYMQATAAMLYRRRVGWLVALVFVNLASSGVIAAFEETLQATIALAFFIPLLIDSGGNAGSQAATLMVRALATRDVRLRDWLRVLWKEVRVGLILGGTMALAAGLLGFYRGDADLALVVGLTMISVVLLANIIGASLPLVLSLVRIDPAVASSPLITSIADTSGLIVYFTIAWLIIGT
jgi:magnesium transporter